MRIGGARRKLIDGLQTVSDRAEGRVRGLVRLSASASMQSFVADPSKLPTTDEEAEPAQDVSGTYYARFDYSAFDGGHLIR